MIIFNLYAIVVAILIVLGALPFVALSHYGIMGEDLSIVLSSWMALIISSLCHKMGIKGRLFYIPMWILAIPLAFLLTFAKFGWVGIACVIGPVVGFVALMLYLGYRSERKRADGLVYESHNIPYDEADPLAFWQAFKDKLFFPTFLGLNEQICDFNARVAKSVEPYSLPLVSLTAFHTEMDNHSRMFDKKRLNKGIIKEFTDEIDAKIAALEKQKPAA